MSSSSSFRDHRLPQVRTAHRLCVEWSQAHTVYGVDAVEHAELTAETLLLHYPDTPECAVIAALLHHIDEHCGPLEHVLNRLRPEFDADTVHAVRGALDSVRELGTMWRASALRFHFTQLVMWSPWSLRILAAHMLVAVYHGHAPHYLEIFLAETQQALTRTLVDELVTHGCTLRSRTPRR